MLKNKEIDFDDLRIKYGNRMIGSSHDTLLSIELRMFMFLGTSEQSRIADDYIKELIISIYRKAVKIYPKVYITDNTYPSKCTHKFVIKDYYNNKIVNYCKTINEAIGYFNNNNFIICNNKMRVFH